MRVVFTIAIVAVAALLGGLGYMIANRGADDIFAQCRASNIAGGSALIGGPFELTDETGKLVTDKDVITGPSLLYFGYTFCPAICPTDNARNAEAIDILEKQGKMVTPIFISFDPERDTSETLAEFTDYMHPRMIGLTGTTQQIKDATAKYRVYFNRPKGGDPEYYEIDHTTFSYLVFPEHGFVEFFKRTDEPEEMAKRIGCFVDVAAKSN